MTDWWVDALEDDDYIEWPEDPFSFRGRRRSRMHWVPFLWCLSWSFPFSGLGCFQALAFELLQVLPLIRELLWMSSANMGQCEYSTSPASIKFRSRWKRNYFCLWSISLDLSHLSSLMVRDRTKVLVSIVSCQIGPVPCFLHGFVS